MVSKVIAKTSANLCCVQYIVVFLTVPQFVELALNLIILNLHF